MRWPQPATCRASSTASHRPIPYLSSQRRRDCWLSDCWRCCGPSAAPWPSTRSPLFVRSNYPGKPPPMAARLEKALPSRGDLCRTFGAQSCSNPNPGLTAGPTRFRPFGPSSLALAANVRLAIRREAPAAGCPARDRGVDLQMHRAPKVRHQKRVPRGPFIKPPALRVVAD